MSKTKSENIDYTNINSIASTFPNWAFEQHNIRINNLKNISKSVNIEGFTLTTPFKDKVLLEYADLIIEPNRRSVLFGRNSTGKTLLFTNISNGQIKNFPKHIHVHHCKELEPHELGDTVLNTVLYSNHYLNALLDAEKQIKLLLEKTSVSDSVSELDDSVKEFRQKLQDNLGRIKMNILSIDGYNAEDRIKKMLKVLGFDENGMQKVCSSLSGGLKMRVALCIAFFVNADLLLLDEPTNHLDHSWLLLRRIRLLLLLLLINDWLLLLINSLLLLQRLLLQRLLLRASVRAEVDGQQSHADFGVGLALLQEAPLVLDLALDEAGEVHVVAAHEVVGHHVGVPQRHLELRRVGVGENELADLVPLGVERVAGDLGLHGVVFDGDLDVGVGLAEGVHVREIASFNDTNVKTAHFLLL